MSNDSAIQKKKTLHNIKRLVIKQVSIQCVLRYDDEGIGVNINPTGYLFLSF